MEDPRVSCAELVYRYAELMDEGDFEGVADLLADAELTFAHQDLVCRGRQAVLDVYVANTRRFPDDGTPKTKHVMTNVMVEVDEGATTARSRSYFTVFQSVPGHLALQPVVAGRYRHRYECRDGKWRIVGKHIIVDLTGELSQHLLIDLS